MGPMKPGNRNQWYHGANSYRVKTLKDEELRLILFKKEVFYGNFISMFKTVSRGTLKLRRFWRWRENYLRLSP